VCLPLRKAWPVMPIHNEWLLNCTKTYGFENIDEVLRHLIYTANAEARATKKLIFKTVRCLHCHVGARADQHRKVDLGSGASTGFESSSANNNNNGSGSSSSPIAIAIHTFHFEWLERVTEACKIASVEKCVRIIIDYYQSRVKQVFHEDGPEAASRKESELFGKNRHDDPRYTASLERVGSGGGGGDTAATTASVAATNNGTATTTIQNDPSACSEEETMEAIRRCQVGRNSSSYAVAMKETHEETLARRAKEIKIEESEETKQARIQIRRALGSPMG